jgi:hypothetical protein
VWEGPAGPERAEYDASGRLVPSDSLAACPWPTAPAALGAFCEALGAQWRLPACPDTHRLEFGRDGTVLVYNKRTGRLDHPSAPAVYRPDGGCDWYVNGVKLDGPASSYDWDSRDVSDPPPLVGEDWPETGLAP